MEYISKEEVLDFLATIQQEVEDGYGFDYEVWKRNVEGLPTVNMNNYKGSLKNKVDELAEVMRQGRNNVNHMCLPSESRSRAQALEDRAMEILEEITGEEWIFTWLEF